MKQYKFKERKDEAWQLETLDIVRTAVGGDCPSVLLSEVELLDLHLYICP
jgi:hypothetical protein